MVASGSRAPRVVKHFVSKKLPLASSTDRNEAIHAALLDILDDEAFYKGEIVASYPTNKCIIDKIEVPFTKHKEIDNTIKFDSESAIPCNAESVCLDWYQISQAKSRTQALIFAAKSEALNDYLQLLETSDAEPAHIVPEFCALFNGACALCDMRAEECLLLVHEVDDILTVAVVQNMRPVWIHNEKVAAANSDTAIISTRIQTMLESEYPNAEFSRLVYIGNKTTPLSEALSGRLDIPLECLSLQSLAKNIDGENAADFAAHGLIAYGLALTALEKAEIDCDLRKDEFAYSARYEPIKSPLLIGMAVLFAILLSTGVYLTRNLIAQQQTLDNIESKIAERWETTYGKEGEVPKMVVMHMEAANNKIKDYSDSAGTSQKIPSLLDALLRIKKLIELQGLDITVDDFVLDQDRS